MKMENRVISVRLSKASVADLEKAAARTNLSTSDGLDLLLRCSVSNGQLLASLKDSPDLSDAKLDVRISISTFMELKSACERGKMSVSVCIRKLLYHLYGTKTVQIVESGGRYTLAYRHD